jgi:hypothetical protein
VIFVVISLVLAQSRRACYRPDPESLAT